MTPGVWPTPFPFRTRIRRARRALWLVVQLRALGMSWRGALDTAHRWTWFERWE